MSSTVAAFLHDIPTRALEGPPQKLPQFGLPEPISMLGCMADLKLKISSKMNMFCGLAYLVVLVISR